MEKADSQVVNAAFRLPSKSLEESAKKAEEREVTLSRGMWKDFKTG